MKQRTPLARRVPVFRSWACAVLLAVLAPPVSVAAGGRPTAAVAAPGELAEARRLIEAGAFDQAVSKLRALVAEHPGDPDARLLLGSALALLPRRTEALEELAAAIRLRPDSAPAHNALGMALARFVEPARARAAFEKAIALDPGLAPAHVNLALVLAQMGQAEPALGHLERAIQLEGDVPAAAQAHHLRGLLLAERDEPERAAGAFGRALALRPDHAETHLHLGLARRRVLDLDGAMAALGEAVRLAPEDARARYELGRELLRAGRVPAAIEHLRAAARSRPEDRAALYSLARALHVAGQAPEAEEVATRLRELQSRGQEADRRALEAGDLNNEGVRLEGAGKTAGAIERYAAALELDPLNTVFRRNLALALCRAGRWKEGVEELREVLRLDPADQDATKALYMAIEMSERRP